MVNDSLLTDCGERGGLNKLEVLPTSFEHVICFDYCYINVVLFQHVQINPIKLKKNHI